MTLLLLAACTNLKAHEKPAPDGGSSNDTASDADADADSDSDADSDADADADTDADADADGDCASPNTTTITTTSDADGYAHVDLPIDALTDAMLVQATSEASVTVDYLYDPDSKVVLDWEDWYDSKESLTDAFYMAGGITTLGWPIRTEEGSLRKGTWQVWVATLDDEGNYVARKEVTTYLRARRCAGSPLVLPVTIVWASTLDQDADLVAAVENAVVRWGEIYAPVGITLDINYYASDLPKRLPEPGYGRDVYSAAYTASGASGLMMSIGDSIDGDLETYGEAGSVPGPVIASVASTVAISWLAHAGQDAKFSPADTELMAETMAHESGHFLGLYHPVEDGWHYWDALADTDHCTTWQDCETALGTNLMFPYPVCNGAVCPGQTDLTADQSVVMNHYAPAH